MSYFFVIVHFKIHFSRTSNSNKLINLNTFVPSLLDPSGTVLSVSHYNYLTNPKINRDNFEYSLTQHEYFL